MQIKIYAYNYHTQILCTQLLLTYLHILEKLNILLTVPIVEGRKPFLMIEEATP